jgi:hypothetical protein
MSEWKTETIDKYGNERVVGLELDDGTFLNNFNTILKNEYDECETFEVISGERMVWYGWGPYDIEAVLWRSTIQKMFDAGALEVVEQ